MRKFPFPSLACGFSWPFIHSYATSCWNWNWNWLAGSRFNLVSWLSSQEPSKLFDWLLFSNFSRPPQKASSGHFTSSVTLGAAGSLFASAGARSPDTCLYELSLSFSLARQQQGQQSMISHREDQSKLRLKSRRSPSEALFVVDIRPACVSHFGRKKWPLWEQEMISRSFIVSVSLCDSLHPFNRSQFWSRAAGEKLEIRASKPQPGGEREAIRAELACVLPKRALVVERRKEKKRSEEKRKEKSR